MTQQQIGSARKHDLDSFLGHEASGGGGASFLENWKKRTPPVVKVVLHTKAPPISVYQHRWPKIVTREVDGKDVQMVYNNDFNSWELESVLQNQYQRDDDGVRKYPPQICPMSIMLEEVERLIRDGEMHWDQLLFAFKGDDKEYDKYLFAGAITNKTKKIWEDKKTTDEMKRKARKKGFPGPADAWMTNMMAKCQYVFTVVDYDDVQSGIQIAKETTLVGDKTKKVIRDRRTSEGDDKGNPMLNPYVLQFTHRKNEKQFQDKYDVVAIAKLEITDEIKELITEKEPPNLDRYTAPGDIVALRASMEDNYCGPEGLLDFDFIFAKAEAHLGIEEGPDESDVPAGQEAGDEPDDEPGETTGEESTEDADASDEQGELPLDEEDKVDRIIAKRKGKGADQECFNAAGERLFGCKKCEAIMLESEDVCHNCGEDYGEDNDGLTDVAEMSLKDCEAELELQTDLEQDREVALKARIDELTSKPPPRRTRSAKGSGKNGAAKGKTGATKVKGGKGTASSRAAAAGKDGVGF